MSPALSRTQWMGEDPRRRWLAMAFPDARIIQGWAGPAAELGEGLEVSVLWRGGSPVGIVLDHGSCTVGASLGDGGWKVSLKTEGLTLSPSLVCPRCGLHGYVRSGRWEAA